MLRRPTTLALAIVCAGLLAGAAAGVAAERQLVDGIAAVVGDQIVLESEIDEEFYLYQMRTGGSTAGIAGPEGLAIRTQIVSEMIDEMLLVAMAKRDTIELEPGMLEAEMDNRIDDLRERHGSQEALEAALEAQGLTIDQLMGMYSDDIERRLLAEMVVRGEIHRKLDVTWGEVDTYYAEHTEEIAQMPETYEIAGILVVPKVSEAAKRVAIERMTGIKDRLEAGEAFEDLAREHSDDASAELGGDLGYVTRGIMVPEFEEAVFALEAGEVSGIVPTRFGFHLIRVDEKEDDRVRARHILARVTPGPADDVLAQARAESLRQLVLAGDDFASVAYEYSDDPISRERGGELGKFTVDGVAPAFTGVLFDLEVGEIAEVVRGDSGYYVLKLVAHEEPHLASLDEIREDLREFLFSLKAEEGYRELLDRLHSEIHIDIRTRMASEQ